MSDEKRDRFEELMRDAALTYNRPPDEGDMPLDAMWSVVEREAFAVRALHQLDETPRKRRSFSQYQWLRVAAALVVGVGIGRVSLSFSRDHVTAPAVTAASEEPIATVTAGSTDSETVSEPFGQATAKYLGQATALLVSLPTEVNGERPDRRLIARASDLLLTTRLLLDSPASSDPALRGLLDDLELVLVQVVRLETERSGVRRTELELIQQAIEQRDVLPRLRSAAFDRAADD
jgi:hypothetical protein